MAYTSCAATFAANIAKDCATPLTGGYTGRGVLIDLADVTAITRDGSNPRIITAITMKAGSYCCVIDNSFGPQPLTGSQTQSNTDDGMMKFRKTVVLNIPRRGADASKDIVEPSYQSPLGYLAVLEKKDRVGDGSYEIVGYGQGLTVNPDGIMRNENENDGDIVVTMSCDEQFFEVTFFDTNYATTKAAFETLMASAF